MKTLLATAAAIAALAGTAKAGTVVIDFEDRARGDLVTTQYAGTAGLTILGSDFGAMIFDSADVTGGDRDLGAPFTNDLGAVLDPGMILIVSEDGDAADPDDRGAGGLISMSWDEAVTFQGFDVFDIDRAEAFRATFFDRDGILATITNEGAIGDNGFARYADLCLFGVVSATFEFSGSGAIDRLVFDQADAVPVPGAALLFATGAAGLAARRKLAAKG